MLVAFVHTGKAFMPETTAYTEFFSRYGITCVVTNPDAVKKMGADVEWFFLGRDRSPRKKGVVRIHEYSSASQPPFRKCKDLSKYLYNSTPDYRVFLNEYVKKSLYFSDKIPFGFRDMGIPWPWLQSSEEQTQKIHDFIYVGDTSPQRGLERLLDQFKTAALRDRSIILISRNYEKLRRQYSAFSNIRFAGPFEHSQMQQHLLEARYALNFIPDKQPFNHQTSTKLLEYAANRIPIISTDYSWVRQFQQKYGGSIFYLSPDLSNFNWKEVNAFGYSFPDLTNWTWEQQIRGSGVLEFLALTFPQFRF